MSIFNIKLKVGDTVMVRKGKYKGQTGKVLAVHRDLNKVTVEGVNVVKRNRKATQARPQGGTFEITKPVWVANVGVVHPTDDKKTSRIGYKVSKSGEKTRVYIQANRKEIAAPKAGGKK